MNILLIDDSKTIREKLKSAFEKSGYTVLETTQGKEAIYKITTGYKPDIIITDLMMPEMNGFEFIREFRQGFNEFKHVPIIVISSKDKKEDVINAIQSGANDYIVKPFKMWDILKKIQNLVPESSESHSYE